MKKYFFSIDLIAETETELKKQYDKIDLTKFIIIKDFGAVFYDWQKQGFENNQYRQTLTIETINKMKQNDIYKEINNVRSQHLKFYPAQP